MINNLKYQIKALNGLVIALVLLFVYDAAVFTVSIFYFDF